MRNACWITKAIHTHSHSHSHTHTNTHTHTHTHTHKNTHTHIIHVSKVVTLTNTLSVLNYGLTKPLGSCVSVVACKTTVNIPDHCHRCRDRRFKPTAITQQSFVKNETRRSGVMISVAMLSEKMETNGSAKLFRVPQKNFEILIKKSECIKCLC